ncbi:MAG: hypothetical protein FJ279_24270 [Planctomycetes bacterium]|nr:hypothetical protein [Planctomycetota bacterium]
MKTHVAILATLDVALGVLAIVGAAAFLILAPGKSQAIWPEHPDRVIKGAVALSAFAFAVGVFALWLGYSLATRQRWARMGQIVFAAASLPGVPVGTVFGLYALWALLRPEAKAFFLAPPPPEPTPQPTPAAVQ